MGAKQFISPTAHNFVLCNETTLVDDAAHASAGQCGWILYGPYLKLSSGIYSIELQLHTPNGDQISGVWDVFNMGHTFGWRRLDRPGNIIVRIPACSALELRVFSERGQSFGVEGFTLEPLLLDEEISSRRQNPDTLVQLARRLIADQCGAEPFFFVLEWIAKLGFTGEAEMLRADFAASRSRSGSAAADAFHDVHEPVSTGALSRRVCRLPSHDEVVAFTSRITFKKIDLCRPVDWQSESERETQHHVEMLGYKYDLLNATRLHRSYKDAARTSDPPPTNSGFLNHLRSVDVEFQHDLLMGIGMSAYCPISGRRLRSRHGFCQYLAGIAFVLYRFEGVETFYICQTEWSGSFLFMYLPKSNIIFQMDPYSRWYEEEAIVSALNINMMLSREAVVKYLLEETRPAAILGSNNLGHFFWNELGGFNRIVEAGTVNLLSAIITIGRKFINVTDFYPEVAHKKISHLDDQAEAFNFFLSAQYVPIRFSASHISDSLAKRIEKAVSEHASANGRPPVNRKGPLVWINLRAHNKSWIGQVEGLSQIFNCLNDKYGSLSVFLDGLADCSTIADQIRALTRAEVVFHMGLDLDLVDSLNWAFHVDAYIATIGSGLVVVNWLAGKHGVAHANLGHMEQLSWWGDVRPSVPRPYPAPLSEIIDDGGFYGNYELDWQSILRALVEVLDSAKFRNRPIRHSILDYV